jgi:hypothetical protein
MKKLAYVSFLLEEQCNVKSGDTTPFSSQINLKIWENNHMFSDTTRSGKLGYEKRIRKHLKQTDIRGDRNIDIL